MAGSAGERDNNIVRLVVISDTHGLHNDLVLPAADLLVHCGDFSNQGTLTEVRAFRQWLEEEEVQQRYPEIILIGGNHDCKPSRSDLKKEFSGNPRINFLNDESILCAGGRICIHGASWETCQRDQFSLACQWVATTSTTITRPVDVFLSHMPPYVPLATKSAMSQAGSIELTDMVLTNRIPLLCCGHFHWGRGAVQFFHGGDDSSNKPSSSWLINCASQQREGVAPPVVIDYNVKERSVLCVQGLDADTICTVKAVSRKI